MNKPSYYIYSACIALVLLLVQTAFIPFISIEGFMPDILLLWLVMIAVSRGQIEATISGFILGLLQDLITMRFFGLAALAKTAAGFFAGYFFNDNMVEQTLGSYRYVMIVVFSSLVQDIIYFMIFFQGAEGSIIVLTVKNSVALMFYTGIVSIFPMFIFSRKYHTSWAQ